MAYKVINKFKEKEDNNTIYEIGDEYPKGNYEPTKKRIEELTEVHPKYKKKFIEFFESEEEKVDREVKEAELKADAERLAKEEAEAQEKADAKLKAEADEKTQHENEEKTEGEVKKSSSKNKPDQKVNKE